MPGNNKISTTDYVEKMEYLYLLSQPNNNNNPNNKTTKTVVGLRLSNRLETHIAAANVHLAAETLHIAVA